MSALLAIFTRWRGVIRVAAAVALLGLASALWHYRSAYIAETAARATDKKAYADAEAEAARLAKAALRHQQSRFDQKAKVSDEKHELQLAGLAAVADDYKLHNRVRIEAAAGAPSAALAASESDPAHVYPEPASAAIVVKESDFDRCTAWVAYGEAAHDWAISLDTP